METGISEKQIMSWLSVILQKEDIENASINMIGTSEKNSGQCGEVIFVNVVKTHSETSNKKYIAIKCSKSNTALMAQSPSIRDAFKNEIYVYEKIFPTFGRFQNARGVTNAFKSVAKYYGACSDEAQDVISLENLKETGYVMWDTCTPLTRKHIDLVVTEYAKFHAVSVAMKELQPEEYQQLVDGIVIDVFKKFFGTYSSVIYFKNNVVQVHDLLKDSLDRNTLEKWLGLKEHIHSICFGISSSERQLEVVTHGDCWNNNFVYKYEGEDSSQVSQVVMLDWQISRISSPVNDLSYFLLACISREDLSNMDTILSHYYESFCCHLAQLGSTVGAKYSFTNFLEEWKKFSKFGVMMSITLLKNSFTRRKHVSEVDNKNDYKNRVQHIVTYAVESGLI